MCVFYLVFAQICATFWVMKTTAFISKLRKIGRKAGIAVRYDPRTGKGSHGRVWYGERFTTVPVKEIGAGLLAKICRDLGIDPGAL